MVPVMSGTMLMIIGGFGAGGDGLNWRKRKSLSGFRNDISLLDPMVPNITSIEPNHGPTLGGVVEYDIVKLPGVSTQKPSKQSESGSTTIGVLAPETVSLDRLVSDTKGTIENAEEAMSFLEIVSGGEPPEVVPPYNLVLSGFANANPSTAKSLGNFPEVRKCAVACSKDKNCHYFEHNHHDQSCRSVRSKAPQDTVKDSHVNIYEIFRNLPNSKFCSYLSLYTLNHHHHHHQVHTHSRLK